MSGWRRVGDIIRGPETRAIRSPDGSRQRHPTWMYQIASPEGVLFRCVRTHVGRTVVNVMGTYESAVTAAEQYVVFDALGAHVGTGINLKDPDRLALLLSTRDHLEYDRGEFV